ncbi:hypothetical protein BDD12DRAFT_320479 [Trichophaea hybrida]|nr:hypothetical protein BDD12DRAFT_320479 [Trichophaea hybrida]
MFPVTSQSFRCLFYLTRHIYSQKFNTIVCHPDLGHILHGLLLSHHELAAWRRFFYPISAKRFVVGEEAEGNRRCHAFIVTRAESISSIFWNLTFTTETQCTAPPEDGDSVSPHISRPHRRRWRRNTGLGGIAEAGASVRLNDVHVWRSC